MRYRSRGQVSLPVVIRIPCGGGIGAVEHHSESPEMVFAHTAGLRVVACSDAADAFTMIQQSVDCDDPVIFFEPKRRYWDKAEVDTAAGVDGALPFDRARVTLEGGDVTLLCYGPLVRTCLESAAAAREDGRGVEVIDLRSLSPLDLDTITASVRKTGRCVVAHEAPVFAGLGARVTERCFYHLEAPVLRVGGFATPYPPSRLEEHYLPDLDRILDADSAAPPLPSRPAPAPDRASVATVSCLDDGRAGPQRRASKELEIMRRWRGAAVGSGNWVPRRWCGADRGWPGSSGGDRLAAGRVEGAQFVLARRQPSPTAYGPFEAVN